MYNFDPIFARHFLILGHYYDKDKQIRNLSSQIFSPQNITVGHKCDMNEAEHHYLHILFHFVIL